MGNTTTKSTQNEQKAKDILDEFATRPTLVERLCARLRPLRPPVCTSKRFFDYFELPDPYHPIDYAREYKPDLGSSVLILGENRRPVAPHATVPPLKPRIESDKPKAPQAFRPQGVPSASTRNSTPPPPPPQKPSSGEFGQKSKHPLKKLPVRPDLANDQNPSQNSSANNSPTPMLNRSIPRPNSKTSSETSRRGNLRMRRSTISNTQPKVTSINPDSVPSSESSSKPSPTVPETTVNRSPSSIGGDGGLDDLFGFGAQEGRMRIPKRSSTSTPSPTQPESKVVPKVPTPPKQVESKPSAPIPAAPKPPVTATPVNRSPSAAGGGGLDDLFGFGAQEGRMRIPKRSSSTSSNSDSSTSRPIFDRNPVQPPDSSKK